MATKKFGKMKTPGKPTGNRFVAPDTSHFLSVAFWLSPLPDNLNCLF